MLLLSQCVGVRPGAPVALGFMPLCLKGSLGSWLDAIGMSLVPTKQIYAGGQRFGGVQDGKVLDIYYRPPSAIKMEPTI